MVPFSTRILFLVNLIVNAKESSILGDYVKKITPHHGINKEAGRFLAMQLVGELNWLTHRYSNYAFQRDV